jgi:hypothetical protein
MRRQGIGNFATGGRQAQKDQRAFQVQRDKFGAAKRKNGAPKIFEFCLGNSRCANCSPALDQLNFDGLLCLDRRGGHCGADERSDAGADGCELARFS